MVDASRSLVEWRELAAAMPDWAAVQVDGEFAYVSEDLASILDATADGLTGESWRSPFGESAVGRLERGLALARAGGEWTGTVATNRVLTPERFERYGKAGDAALRLAFDHAGITEPGEVPEPVE